MNSPSVSVLQAKAEIANLVAQFDDAVNRRNVTEFEQLWAPDATSC